MINYRLALDSDLLQVAQIHKAQFPTHYLGQFSISLLRAFYKNLLDDGHVFVVAEENGEVFGFVLGGEWKKISESLSSFIKKNFVRSLLETSVRPKTWKKVFKKLFLYLATK